MNTAIASAPPAWANSARPWPEIMGKSLILKVSCFLVIVNQRGGQNLLPNPALPYDAEGGEWLSVSAARFCRTRRREYDEAWLKTS
jgi:hypothetical protein